MNFEAELLIPIFAVLMPVFIVFIVMFFRAKDRAETQKTVRMAIEKGQPLPQDYLDSLQRTTRTPKAPANDIRSGLILIAVGVGMAVWSYIDHGYLTGLAGVACIPGFIGVALLIIGLIGNGKKS
jgi:Flp pilus assembly protein TadB